MSIEAIKEIREVELLAEEKIKAAQQQAKDLILQTEEKAERLIRDSVDAQLAKNKALIEAAAMDANKEAEARKQLNTKQCELLKEKADVNFEKAVKMVMERIVK
ncbi:MAG: hypothetical protein ACOZCL_18695 [Bacillota bacterium]